MASSLETPLGNQNVINLLRVVAQRVADRQFNELVDGRARTDGQTVWLPFTDSTFTPDDLIGLAAHEGAHVRFQTVFDLDVHEEICPENPMVGKAILNVLEDARIDRLLRMTYEGFWMDLNLVNQRLLQASVARVASLPRDVLAGDRAVDFLVSLMCFHMTGNGSLFYDERFKNEDGSFKFACPALGSFWKVVLDADRYLRSRPVFAATLVAGKMVIDAMRGFLHDAGIPPPREDAAPGDRGDAAGPPDRENGPGKAGSPLLLSMDRQRVTRPLDSSGVESAEVASDEIAGLDRIRIAMKDSKASTSDILEDIEDDMVERVDAMKQLLASLKQHTTGLGFVKDKEFEFIESDTGNRKVIVDVIDGVQELRDFNDVGNPAARYQAIVSHHRHAIQQLRQALSTFQVQPRMERGSRKGITCTRDLARVVSSRGKFDRPFMTNHEKSGACLLIMVDESMSMSQDDMDGTGDADVECPLRATCEVLRACECKDECEDAGCWPKVYSDCEHETACPMRGLAPPADDGIDDGCTGMRIHVAKSATVILAEALKNTRIDFSVIGFSAFGGQNKIVEKIYKDFSEPVNPQKMGSIWVSESSPENRDGTSMLVARRHFNAIQNKCPIMIVISDGEPYHGGTDYVGETAIAMTSAAVNAIKQSLRLFALSIDTRGEEYLERIYGKDRFFVVRNGKDVARALVYLVKSIASALRA